MHDWGILIPIAAITIGPIVWVANTWIRAKHGYPLDDDGDERVGDTRKIDLLTSENARQADQITRLEERLRVLERIATDPATRTAREIDALR